MLWCPRTLLRDLFCLQLKAEPASIHFHELRQPRITVRRWSPPWRTTSSSSSTMRKSGACDRAKPADRRVRRGSGSSDHQTSDGHSCVPAIRRRSTQTKADAVNVSITFRLTDEKRTCRTPIVNGSFGPLADGSTHLFYACKTRPVRRATDPGCVKTYS